MHRGHIIIRIKNIYTLIIILILLFLFCDNRGFAQDILKEALSTEDDSPLEIVAERIDYYEEGNRIAEGNVVIKRGALKLSSDKVEIDRNNKVAKVPGEFLVESGEDILSGESAVFDLEEQTGKINAGKLFLTEGHYYINGDPIEKTGESTYRINDFRLTTCDGGTPVWSITGKEVRVPLEGYASIRGAAFRFHDVPILYVPYMVFPAKTERQTGLLLPSVGYSDLIGFEIEVPFFWAISDRADATFYERYMSDRGLMQGFELRYVSDMDSKGTYNFDILSDRIEEKDMNNPDQAELSQFPRTNSARYWLRGRTEQQLPWGVRARMDADVVSDQDYLREFEGGLVGFEERPDLVEEYGRPLEEETSPTRRSAIRFSRDSQNYSLQALSSYYQRPEGFLNDTTPQPLMGMSFSLLPRSIKGLKIPLSFAINADYDYIWREFGIKGHNLSISPYLTYPARIGSYLEFESSLSYTRDMQWLGGNNLNIDTQSRDAVNFQTGLSTIMERVYDKDWKEVKRIKHKLAPSLIYEYRYHKDENRYQPWFDPVDAEGNFNRLAFSLENFLDAKKVDEKGNVSYSQWGTLRIIQGYDIDEARRDSDPGIKKEPFEPLTAELTFSPFDRLYFDAEARWDHYTEDFTFADISLKFDMERSGERKDEYRIDYVYTDSGDKGLSYYFDVNIAKGFSVGSSLNRDIDMDHDIEKGYWINYEAQCWEIRLGVEKRDNESRILLNFQLLGFGS
jgi:LPS-assembly protein